MAALIGPLGLYILLSLIVAIYGRRVCHGFARLWALAIVATPVLTLAYVQYLERRLTKL